MTFRDLILKKKNGGSLTDREIRFFIQAYTKGDIPDYQVSAFMMAVCFQGLDERETLSLTREMLYSGETIDLSVIKGVKVDKHSTGGVGDTTSLIVGPLVASCGVPVAKMSGRGLGHTGGTIDKLESIPGFRTDLASGDFIRQVNRFKLALIGQTGNLAPADKKLYALRDVTGTIDNVSLIASSIMSKKLAAGSDAIVLDVKTGRGAFMHSLEASVELAETMVRIGSGMGRRTVALITDMDQPLGHAVGNALEVKEALQVLAGNGPADLTELCLFLAAEMISMGLSLKPLQARRMAEDHLSSGKAFETFRAFVAAQGGDVSVLSDPSLLPKADRMVTVPARSSGYVESIEAMEIGIASVELGAGRRTKEEAIDFGAGIVLHAKRGEWVNAGDSLADLHLGRSVSNAQAAVSKVQNAFEIGEEPPSPAKLIKARVDMDRTHYY